MTRALGQPTFTGARGHCNRVATLHLSGQILHYPSSLNIPKLRICKYFSTCQYLLTMDALTCMYSLLSLPQAYRSFFYFYIHTLLLVNNDVTIQVPVVHICSSPALTTTGQSHKRAIWIISYFNMARELGRSFKQHFSNTLLSV